MSFFLSNLHINSFLLVLLDAFSSRFFNTNVLFLYTLYSSFFFWCLVQSVLFLFLKLAFLCYSSTALAGGYSCVTLTLTLCFLAKRTEARTVKKSKSSNVHSQYKQ